MFQPAPRSRHRRLPTGTTMVSYAEVKSYLSKREIPQLFESLMAGLMYHRPENHIGYLQSCLDEVKSNSDAKVQWSTFVNAKKRKSKEILPPLTPKKQDSFSSSWSDNSRQSTPLPPISARTRTRTSMENQDFRNTYILYHNPPPVLAKPKVPVISVLGGLGTRIDELCERVVSRLRGLVHISTCSMLKTRMTIEGFYRVTSVPACAVVDSVLQAMSMVQSANALLVAGFPRNRGDIEEYRSRRVRMDGVVLVDFEEEALRNFLEHEVASGVVRTSEIDAELERFKQDIISVAEYYDEKELLTVVMGDQDTEEMVDDLVLAIDKIIETRKNILDEETMESRKDRETDSPRNALMPSPDKLERPSTVEIRDATEEDIKSIEAEAKKSEENEDVDEEVAQILSNDKSEEVDEELKIESEVVTAKAENELSAIVSEKDTADEEEEKAEVVDETPNIEEKMEIERLEREGIRINSAEEETGKEKSDEIVKSEPMQQLSLTSELNAKESEFQIMDDGSKEQKSEEEEKEKSSGDYDDSREEDNKALEKNIDETTTDEIPNIPIIFAFENINFDYDEIRNLVANELEMCFIDFQELMRNDGSTNDKFDDDESLLMLRGILRQDSVSYSNGFFILKFPFSLLSKNFTEQLLKLGHLSFVCKVRENKPISDSESKEIQEEKLFHSSFSEKVRIIFVTEDNMLQEIRDALQEIINSEKAVEKPQNETEGGSNVEDQNIDKMKNSEGEVNVSEIKEIDMKDENKERISTDPNNDNQAKDAQDNEDVMVDDKTEDSTGKDIEDLVSDDTLNEGSKPTGLLVSDGSPDEQEIDDTHSQASTLPSAADETQRERATLERQGGVEVENDNLDDIENNKVTLIRQDTYCAGEETKDNVQKDEPGNFSAENTNEDELEKKAELSENKEETVTEKESMLSETKEEVDLENKEDISEGNEDMGAENKEAVSEGKEHTEAENKDVASGDKEDTEAEMKDVDSEGKQDADAENSEVVSESKDNLEENGEAVSEAKDDAEAEKEDMVSECKDDAEPENNEMVSENKNDTEEANKEAISESEENAEAENEEVISEGKEETDAEKEEVVSEDKGDTDAEKEEVVSEGKEDTDAEKEEVVSEGKGTDSGNNEAISNGKDDVEVENLETVSEGKEDTEAENKESISEGKDDTAEEKEKSASENTEADNEIEVSESKEEIEVSESKEEIEVSESKEEIDNESIVKEENGNRQEDENTCDINPESSDEPKLEVIQTESNQNNEDSSEAEKDVSEKQEENVEKVAANDENEDNGEVQDEANAEVANSLSEGIDNDVNQAEAENPPEHDDSKGTDDSEDKENEVKSEASNLTENQSLSVKNDSQKDATVPNEENDDIEEKSSLSKVEDHSIDENTSESLKNLANNDVPDEVLANDQDTSDVKSQINDENEANIDGNNNNDGSEIQSDLPNEAEEKESNEEHKSISSAVSEEGNKDQLEQESVDDKADEKDEVVLHKIVKEIRKVPDNDSDSNDENITIETQAEVHAVDCVSPPTAEIDKSDAKSLPGDTEDVSTGDAIPENETQTNDKDNSSDNNEMGNKAPDEEIILGNDESEGLSIKDMDSMRSETFSGKIQERNGSGILDESRNNDQRESEEPQERSSSSSRGEL